MSQEKEQRGQEELPQDTWKSVLLRWILPIVGCIVSPAIVVFAILLFIKHWNEIRTLDWAGSGWLVGTVMTGILCAAITVRAYTTTYGNMAQLARHFFPTSQTPNDSSQPTSPDSGTEPPRSRKPHSLRRQRIRGHCACIVLLVICVYFLIVAMQEFVSQLHNYQAFPSGPLIACTLIVSLLVQATINIVVVEYHTLQSTVKHLWKERFIPSIESMPLFPTILIWEVLAIAAFSLLAYLWGGWAIWESLTGTGNISSLDIVKIALTTVGGLGAVGYIVIRYRDSQASKRAEERELSRMVDDKMQAAINQLGAEQASTRIAGVYALAEIADMHHGGQHNGNRPDDDYRQRIVDILCGYLRSDRGRPTTDENGKPRKDGNYDKAVESTIIAVIRKHLQKERSDEQGNQVVAQTLEDDQLWCACSFDLHGAHIHETFDLSGATIQTSMNCDNVQFHGGARFRNCIIRYGSFVDATIKNTWFDYATITGTRFGGATITGTRFTGATITGTQFDVATITDAQFDGATITGTQFDGATITDARFTVATITDTWFDGATITGTRFTGATITDTWFIGATITDTCFIDTTITDTWFIDTTITDTWFTVATITDAQFDGATITGTWFDYATITDTWFDGATIANTRFDYATIKAIRFAGIRDQGGITFKRAKFQSKDNDFGPIKLESNGLPKGAEWDIQP